MFKPLPKPSNLISFDKIQMQLQANKALENAVSELSFDRFKYARDEVIHALELLDQMIDNWPIDSFIIMQHENATRFNLKDFHNHKHIIWVEN